MPNLEEPVAALFLAAVLLATLVAMGRGALSERQQTGAWVVLTLLFFSMGSVFFRGNPPQGTRLAAESALSWRGR